MISKIFTDGQIGRLIVAAALRATATAEVGICPDD